MVSIKIDKQTMTGIRLLSKRKDEYGAGTLSGVIANLVYREITQKGLAIYCNNGYFGDMCIVEDTNGRIKDNPTGHNRYAVAIVGNNTAHLMGLLKEPTKEGRVITGDYWVVKDVGNGFAWAMTGIFKEDGTPLMLGDIEK